MVNRVAEDHDSHGKPPVTIKLYHRILKKSMKKDQELIVITKTYDLILLVVQARRAALPP